MSSERLDLAQVIAALDSLQGEDEPDTGEGLRERKKRRLRQRISDTATALFLTHGFENVTVAEVAEACDVSTQTVFNYFATKEAMFFDRTESVVDELADSIRSRERGPIVDAVRDALQNGSLAHGWPPIDERSAIDLVRRFCETADGSPTLVAAQNADFDRATRVIAAALGDRTGTDAEQPDVQMAASMIVAIARVRVRSTSRHIGAVSRLAALDEAIRRDVDIALRTAAPALEAFDATD